MFGYDWSEKVPQRRQHWTQAWSSDTLLYEINNFYKKKHLIYAQHLSDSGNTKMSKTGSPFQEVKYSEKSYNLLH